MGQASQATRPAGALGVQHRLDQGYPDVAGAEARGMERTGSREPGGDRRTVARKLPCTSGHWVPRTSRNTSDPRCVLQGSHLSKRRRRVAAGAAGIIKVKCPGAAEMDALHRGPEPFCRGEYPMAPIP